MKASLRWIREFIDLPTEDADEVATVLSNLGIEVEGVETVDVGFRGVIVAKVLSVRSHPNADKVRIATLDVGADDPIDVVCGAWNFEAGATVAYATVGSLLPGGFEIGEKDVRGFMSPGMICSEIELGIGEEKGGIVVLGDGYAEPGTDFASTLPYPDTVFDLSITPNRPDAMSIHGLARDLGAHFDIAVATPTTILEESGTTRARVSIDEPERCTRFTAREVAGVTIGQSPLWMRLRLRDAGVRPISNVVDVSNYVMLELGQPLHAFDLDRITDETIVVRLANDGERLTTLDGVERTLSKEDLLIAGTDAPLGLAGVMGGGDSEVSADTTRVLIEVAHFEPSKVLLTGKRHGLRTEAVSRFERGVDPELPPVASARAAALIVSLAGGSVVGGFIDEYPTPATRASVELAGSEVKRLLGGEIPVADQADYLGRLGFSVTGLDPMTVGVPTYRPDVTRPADLVEEIARLHGYNNLPSILRPGAGGGLGSIERRYRAARSAMVGAGFFEVMSFDFLDAAEMTALGFPEGDRRGDPIAIRNPLSEDLGHMRTTLMPGLLAGLRRTTQRNRPNAMLFEMGRVYLRGSDSLPDQPMHLGFVGTGPRGMSQPDLEGADATGIASHLLRVLGYNPSVSQDAHPGFHPGRSATVLVGGVPVGVVGEVDPALADRYDIPGRVVFGELDLTAFPTLPTSQFSPPSSYPPAVFDLAFDLPESAPAAALLERITDAAGPLLEAVEVFDVFRGGPLSSGRKSVAVRLSFRAQDRTLVDEELVPVREAIAARVADDLDGRLRGG